MSYEAPYADITVFGIESLLDTSGTESPVCPAKTGDQDL